MTVPIERVARLLREVSARHVMPRYRTLDRAEIHEKAPGDLVTIADIEAEEALGSVLRDLLPGSIIIGEESCARDVTLRARLDRDAIAWIIDPVDGTKNFAAGSPVFAMIVALVQHGETVGAWIYDPVRDYMATAEKGQGAWAEGRRLSVATARDRARGKALLGTAFSLRCSGQHYLALAGGRTDFALYRGLQPWDHAAGLLLHEEAGGYARFGDGTRYDPVSDGSDVILAPSEELWHRFHDLLQRGIVD